MLCYISSRTRPFQRAFPAALVQLVVADRDRGSLVGCRGLLAARLLDTLSLRHRIRLATAEHGQRGLS
eukprot:5466491-Pyramimonas_sp.AAC.2